jgi:CO dehydrogenase maturation factor
MEAGLEHLGRGSSRNVDCLLIVVEPNRRSLETAHRIRLLAGDLGIARVTAVANKTTCAEDVRLIEQEMKDVPLVAAIPYSTSLAGFSVSADLDSIEPPVREALEAIYASISSS